MLKLKKIPTELFDANCYVISAPDSDQALIVDPGLGAAAAVESFLEASALTVGAVLLTHGHADHVWDAAAVAQLGEDVPVYVPAPDRYWLEDPLGLLNMGALPVAWIKPSNIVDVPEGDWEVIPGIVLKMVPAPGHSPGSALFLLGDSVEDSVEVSEKSALSGDVIFAGSIGRTDLPGGDDQVMRATLRTLKFALNPQTKLLPGHGPDTMWSTELRSNPYVMKAR